MKNLHTEKLTEIDKKFMADKVKTLIEIYQPQLADIMLNAYQNSNNLDIYINTMLYLFASSIKAISEVCEVDINYLIDLLHKAIENITLENVKDE